jgi:hypothetical protein
MTPTTLTLIEPPLQPATVAPPVAIAIACMEALAVEIACVRPSRDEREVQDAVWTVMERLAPGVFKREFRLSAHERPDFFHPPTGVAIECKARNRAQSAASLVRQIGRYSKLPQVRGILFATCWPHLVSALPREVNGVPVRVAFLVGGALG